MFFKTVAWILTIVLLHHGISYHLCYDGSAGDIETFSVAPYNGFSLREGLESMISINEEEGGCYTAISKGPLHREEAGPQYVDLVNFFVSCDADAYLVGPLCDPGENIGSLFGGKEFGVIDLRRMVGEAVPDDARRNDGAREGPSACFIDSTYKALERTRQAINPVFL